MYVGHVGVALGLRASRGAPPLWLLVLAAQGPDWADVAWEALGLPRNYPWWKPHALIPMAVGTLCAAAVGARVTRRGRAAALTALAYLAHWPADYMTGFKPTWPHGPNVGLGLYGDPGIDFWLEATVLLFGWLVWYASLPDLAGSRRRGRAGLALGMLAALLAAQAAADWVMAHGWGPLA